MKFFAGAALMAVLLSSNGWAQDKESQTFLTEAMEGNFAEVQMGQLAQKNGTAQGVKTFGQMLEKDHGDANRKAKAAADALKMTAPTGPNTKQKADYDRIAKLTGAAFDSEFAKHMVMDHENDIKAYEKEATKNDAAGAYAKETLPTLRKHLQTAQSLTTAQHPAAPSAQQLEPGANSFTEAQAKSRLEAAGYTNISDLKKDEQGFWRGTAMKDGKRVNVALDFRGNISTS